MAKPISIGVRVASNYEVLRPLSAGGFGSLFIAENRSLLGQLAVVKVLKGHKEGASAEEAKVLATVEHPNVVHVYAHDTEFDCIVMQYLSGVTLHSLVGRLNPVTAVRVAQSVALALDAVHQKQLVHRDVKPENILVEGKRGELGWVKLIDFGLALKIGKQNELCGTPEYCPGEQFTQTSNVHPSTDVYALGVMLFELCSTRLPFIAETSEALGRMHLSAPVPDLVTVRRSVMNPQNPSGGVEVQGEVLDSRVLRLLERVNGLVHEMMAKQPEARPDAKAVARRLDEIEREFSSESTQVGFRVPEATTSAPLIERARTSTMLLPRLGPARAPTTDQALTAIAPPKRRRGLVAALLVLAALMLLFWVVMKSGITESEVAAAPAVVQQPAVVQPEVVEKQVQLEPVVEAVERVVERVDSGEELHALPSLPDEKVPVATTARTVEKKSFLIMQAPECEPNGDWKERARADLEELTQRSSKRTELLVYAADQNMIISNAIRQASTRGECGAVEQKLQDFNERVKGKGAVP